MPSQNAKPKHLKERRILRCVTMAALGLFALSSCADAGSSSAASQASGEVTPLRLADDYAPAHPFVEYGASVFIDEAEASGVPIDYFPAAQMGTPEDLAVLLETEVLDAGSTAPAYLESKFPLSSVSDLPSDVSDSCVAANAMMDLLGEDGILYQEEFKPAALGCSLAGLRIADSHQKGGNSRRCPRSAHPLGRWRAGCVNGPHRCPSS